MGRKQANHEQNKPSIKNRREQKIKKGKGIYKKLNKSLAPPDLSRFKQKLVDQLKNKCNQSYHHVTEQLESCQRLNISHFIDQQQIQPQTPLQDNNNQQPYKINTIYQNSNKYSKQLKQLIQSCDIILQVLDVRDPLSCRCKNIQKKILSMQDKKIIIILNKIDLVPMQNAYAWQNYLRRQYPVVMFKANLQNQKSHLAYNTVFKKSVANHTDVAQDMVQCSKAVGPDHLIQLIKQLSRVQGSTRAVTVGLIGYPNVGKSSIINSLKREKSCEVSTMPGTTKNLKQIKLDHEVKLIDCPGVIFQKYITKNQLILQNTLKYHQNLSEVVQAIIQRISVKELKSFYKIEEFISTTDFLVKICKMYGRLAKKGIPQLNQGARIVVEDWNRGKLKYFTYPPPNLLEEQQMVVQQ